VATLGGNYPMLAGNLTAIFLSGFIHFVVSKASPQNYDWESMKNIKLIEDDQSGLDEELFDMAELEEAFNWINKRGWALTIIFVIVWPALSLPEGVFSKPYFAFWVFISLLWGFVAATVIIVLPIHESWDAIVKVLMGMMGGSAPVEAAPASDTVKGPLPPLQKVPAPSQVPQPVDEAPPVEAPAVEAPAEAGAAASV